MMERFSLKDRTALVTGAGKGIGRACVEVLAEAGARVIAVARTQDDLDSLAQDWGGQIEGWCCDVRNPDFHARIEAMEGLHILVNNAGTNAPMPFVDVDHGTLDDLLGMNLRSAFLTAQSAVRTMLRGDPACCSIINMSSQMGHVGSPNRTVYCMTKHGIEGLTKAMAVELASTGLRVNSVAPTFIETPMTRPMFEKPEFAAFALSKIPLGRVGNVGDVAAAVLYLASDAAAMVTGHSLRVDGGWTAE